MGAAVIVAIVSVLLHKFDKSNTIGDRYLYSKVGYENVGTYSENLVPMKIYNQWGYCDCQGKVVIVPRFYRVGAFSQGVAPVQEKENGLYGYIDTSGSYVKELQFAYAGQFSEDLAVCGTTAQTKLGYINKSGDFVIPEQYYVAGDFSEGLAKVKENKDSLYCFIDTSGKIVISPRYQEATNFSEGVAAVSENGKWGYIDKTGAVIIPPQYDNAQEFHAGLAAVEVNGKWGYIDKTGKSIIQMLYEEAGIFSDGVAPVQLSQSGLWGYIDNTGDTIISANYQEAVNFSEGVASIKDNSQWFLVIDSSVAEQTVSTSSPKGEYIVEQKNPGTEKEDAISFSVNGTIPLTGTLQSDKIIEKLLLRVIGEDGSNKGTYLSIKPKSKSYSLNEVILDGRIAPFNVVGKYTLQFIGKLQGDAKETLLGQTAVEVKPLVETSDLVLDLGLINGRGYPNVNLSCSVNEKGVAQNNLDKEQFSIYESIDGQTETEQMIDTIIKPRSEDGLSIALVFDSSLSMYNEDRTEANSRMDFAKKSAITFIQNEGLGEKDSMSIQSFGRAFTLNQKFTSDTKHLMNAIKDIYFQPDTAIFDAIIKSIDTMSSVKGKKCIIIFTDGEDNASKRTYTDSIERAISNGVPVFSIAIGEEAKTNELKRISDLSGGSFYYLKDIKELSTIYKEITEQLRNQYQLSFHSNSGAESGAKIKLRLEVKKDNSSIEGSKSYSIPK